MIADMFLFLIYGVFLCNNHWLLPEVEVLFQCFDVPYFQHCNGLSSLLTEPTDLWTYRFSNNNDLTSTAFTKHLA